MDLSPTPNAGEVRNPLLRPPVLDSPQWLDWKPSQPLLKTDTLLAPGAGPERSLPIPFEYERTLPRTS